MAQLLLDLVFNFSRLIFYVQVSFQILIAVKGIF